MKAYIQDLCGDEDPVVIDVAILECCLQDVIFEKLVGKPINKTTQEEIVSVVYDLIEPYLPPPPSMIIDLTSKRGDDENGKTICWNAE